jgi:hypothetical protein
MPNGVTELGALFGIAQGYGFFVIAATAFRKSTLLSDERFSRAKFYALMGWVPLVFLVLALAWNVRFLAFFFAAGASGIAAEVLVSIVWRAFFSEPIWSYSFGAVARGFTSTLNFLPWATGGLLFHATGRCFRTLHPQADVFPARAAIVFAVSLAVGLAFAWPLSRATSARRGVFSKSAFAVFCLPIGLAAIALATLCSPIYLVLMSAFAAVGFITEYGYGRGMRVFFDRGLWTYHPWKIDDGHSSYVTFPLWSIGGMFFHFLACAVGI